MVVMKGEVETFDEVGTAGRTMIDEALTKKAVAGSRENSQ